MNGNTPTLTYCPPITKSHCSAKHGNRIGHEHHLYSGTPFSMHAPCISVASLEYPSAHPHVSTRTSWMSMERMGAFARSTTTVPVKGLVMQHLSESRWPRMRKSGMLWRSLTLARLWGVMEKSTGLGSSVFVRSLYSTMNSTSFCRSLLRKDRFISTTIVYCTFTNTPWYVSYSVLLGLARRGSSKGISVTPLGIYHTRHLW